MPADIRVEGVTFISEGDRLAGHLYLPASAETGLPAAVVAGTWTSVKEQMAGRYAAALAQRGTAALAFDFRGYGESHGEPRDCESPRRKVDDIRSAVGFLACRDEIDPERIGALGVCAGGAYVAVAAAGDRRVKAVAMVAPWLHDSDLVAGVYGPDLVAERIAAGEQARARYERTGVVDYIPIVTTAETEAAIAGGPDYYLNAERGAIPEWSNRFAVMAWPDWLRFDPIAMAPRLTAPTMVVHSEDAVLPDGVRRFCDGLGGLKEERWISGGQFDFYDHDPTVATAMDLVAGHFGDRLLR